MAGNKYFYVQHINGFILQHQFTFIVKSLRLIKIFVQLYCLKYQLNASIKYITKAF